MSHLSVKQYRELKRGLDIVSSALFTNSKDPGVVDTPARVAKFLMEFNQPLDAKAILGIDFDAEATAGQNNPLVIQRDIPFRALCMHHLLPFFGKAAIAYIPRKRVVGLSKLARLVEAVGVSAPSIQEKITDQIVDAMMEHADAAGSMVIIEATHTCMAVRGVNTPSAVTVTSAIRGIFRDVPHLRQEALTLIKGEL